MPYDLTANISALCRVCMAAKEGHRTNIYDSSSLVAGQPSLHEMLKAICAPVFGKTTAEYPPGMPAVVCATCRNTIIAAFKLYQTCIDTNRRLRKLLGLRGEFCRGSDEIGEDNGDPLKCSNDKRKQREVNRFDLGHISNSQPSKNEASLLNDESSQAIKVEELELIDESGNEGYESEFADEDVIADNDDKKGKTCKICLNAFSEDSLLRKHMKQKHQLHMCEFCHETFGSYSWYAKHKLQHKTSSGYRKVYAAPIECSECGRTMANTASLRRHLQGGRCAKMAAVKQKCSECNATFPTRSALVKHRRIHNSFKCSICGKSLVTKQALQGHLQRHSKHKPYPCDKCSMRFYTKGELKYHLPSHKLDKPSVDREQHDSDSMDTRDSNSDSNDVETN